MLAIDETPRCRGCNKLLAEKVTRPWVIKCGRCKVLNRHNDQGIPRRTRLIEDLVDES